MLAKSLALCAERAAQACNDASGIHFNAFTKSFEMLPQPMNPQRRRFLSSFLLALAIFRVVCGCLSDDIFLAQSIDRIFEGKLMNLSESINTDLVNR